jgi:hypothetical protein
MSSRGDRFDGSCPALASIVSDRASHTNICFARRPGNKSKQFSRPKSDHGASRAWNQQDLNIQQRLSDCSGVCRKGIHLEA